MACLRFGLVAFCAAALCRSGAADGLDEVCLLQQPAPLEGLLLPHLHVGATERDQREGVALLETRAETAAQASARGMVLPSLAQIIVPTALVGAALLGTALSCGCRGQKGAGFYASGCCGGLMLALALGLAVAKVLLAKMAGPAPSGPVVLQPMRSSMQVQVFAPFTAEQINRVESIHELYRQGMQSAVGGDVVVVDVNATGISEPNKRPFCEVDPPTWQSSAGSSCQDYAERQWCTADGGYGPGWVAASETFQQYTSGQYSAATACCQCGGGRQAGASNTVSLSFVLESANTTQAPSTPDVTFDKVNQHIRRLAAEVREKMRAAEGSAPGWVDDVATGSSPALSEDEFVVAPPGWKPPEGQVVTPPPSRKSKKGAFQMSTEANIRCTAHHPLNRDLQEAGRAVLKQKAAEVVKFIEGAAAERSWLRLQLSERCNDPGQAEALRVCIGDGTAWADFVSKGKVTLPHNERSMEAYLCKVSCDIQKAMVDHKKDAIQMMNERVKGFRLDDGSISISCSPGTQQCPPCT